MADKKLWFSSRCFMMFGSQKDHENGFFRGNRTKKPSDSGICLIFHSWSDAFLMFCGKMFGTRAKLVVSLQCQKTTSEIEDTWF